MNKFALLFVLLPSCALPSAPLDPAPSDAAPAFDAPDAPDGGRCLDERNVWVECETGSD